ncbi:hypothetical protein F4778DRAFT_395166 [Xylariomycetidae sp. FL2044]|nr:hypothetical protein F4778DRAFT_395166 [Xylariomycetidae sp. FL2044]
MPPPRTLFQRLLLLRPAASSDAGRRLILRRTVRHTSLSSRVRPQLAFLSAPLSKPQQFRYLTTERKKWLVYELVLTVKYVVGIGLIIVVSCLMYWALQQEWLERWYPTPDEWRYLTRLRFRLAAWGPDRPDEHLKDDWVQVGDIARQVMKRLEDPRIDGAGLRELTEGGIWIDGIGNAGYDITAKSEPWRRGYYQTLMLCARAAEYLDDWTLDRTRRIVFPKNMVIGPSNPNRKPIPAGSPPAPLEENCEPAIEPPETFYMKILTTKGFTSKQKMDAALGYASWLDFKELPEPAERMYEWALSLATESSLPAQLPYDPKSYVLQDGPRPPSANVLTTLTAFAVHKARNGDTSTALPIMISILRARKSLPVSPSTTEKPLYDTSETYQSPWTFPNMVRLTKNLFTPPKYPPPPDDGESPPVRGPKELCEEAGLNLYIGEILYASRAAAAGGAGREEGLAWTRDAVDLAEEQLHRLTPGPRDTEAKKTCRDCLNSGLDNWSTMVARLAREEEEKQLSATGGGAPAKSSTSSWLGLWGQRDTPEGEAAAKAAGRWAAEEKVVKERKRRAQEVMEELEPPPSGLASIFTA